MVRTLSERSFTFRGAWVCRLTRGSARHTRARRAHDRSHAETRERRPKRFHGAQVHRERTTEHRHNREELARNPRTSPTIDLPRNDRDSPGALLPPPARPGGAPRREDSLVRLGHAALTIGHWHRSKLASSPEASSRGPGHVARAGHRRCRPPLSVFSAATAVPTSFGCGWRRRSRFGRRSLRTRPSREVGHRDARDGERCPRPSNQHRPWFSARSSAASMTGVRRSCGSRAF
jgi:hypothetical protein